MAEKHGAKIQRPHAKNTKLEERLGAAEDAKRAAAALQRQLEEIKATQESALEAKDIAEGQRNTAVAEVKKLRASLKDASEELYAAHQAQARQREEIRRLQEESQRLRTATEAAKAEAQEELKKAHEAEMKLQETEQMMEDLKCQLSEAQAARDLLHQLNEDAKVTLEEISHRPNFSIPNTSFVVEDRPHQGTHHQQEEIGKQQSSPHISKNTTENAMLKASQRQTSAYFQSYVHMKAQYDIKVDQLLRSRASEKYLNARLASCGQQVKKEFCDAFTAPSSTTPSFSAQSTRYPVTKVVHLDDDEGTGVSILSQVKPASKLGKRLRKMAPQEFNKRRSG